jgi:hypothetical protein
LLRPEISTSALSAANARAISSPIPWLAPTTWTDFPANLPADSAADFYESFP